MIRVSILICLSLMFSASFASAQSSEAEIRAREVGYQLRCVVCQNQSIEDSDAKLAEDMRIEVREQIAAGASNEDVIAYMRNNYGDYVLLKPPVQPNTYALWFLPAFLILFGFIWFIRRAKRKPMAAQAQPDLTSEDKSLLEDLMRDTS